MFGGITGNKYDPFKGGARHTSRPPPARPQTHLCPLACLAEAWSTCGQPSSPRGGCLQQTRGRRTEHCKLALPFFHLADSFVAPPPRHRPFHTLHAYRARPSKAREIPTIHATHTSHALRTLRFQHPMHSPTSRFPTAPPEFLEPSSTTPHHK